MLGGGEARVAIWLPALAAEEVLQQQEGCVFPASAVLLVGTAEWNGFALKYYRLPVG